MKKTAIALAALASLGAGALIATAEAQMQQPGAGVAPNTICGERTQMVRTLLEEFREEPQAVGMVDKDAVIEVFASANGSWTILATGTDGQSCLVASGEGWDNRGIIIGAGA